MNAVRRRKITAFRAIAQYSTGSRYVYRPSSGVEFTRHASTTTTSCARRWQPPLPPRAFFFARHAGTQRITLYARSLLMLRLFARER